jgi:tetratricopeptide (TPR) repeat protein
VHGSSGQRQESRAGCAGERQPRNPQQTRRVSRYRAQFDTPLEQATTPSLEALKAFSLGRQLPFSKDATAAILYFKLAIQTNPNFAVAYVWLGRAFRDVDENASATQNARKAYKLVVQPAKPGSDEPVFRQLVLVSFVSHPRMAPIVLVKQLDKLMVYE